MSKLPEETYLKIISYLEVRDLCRCSQVSALSEKISIPPNANVKTYITSHAAVSLAGVAKQFKRFARTMRLNLNVHFECVFPNNPAKV